MQLIAINETGEAPGHDAPISDDLAHVLRSTATLYETGGFVEPWIGYLGIKEGIAVGTCGFKSPPVDGRVEIAYFTFPQHEGRGFATDMAAELVAIARRTDGTVLIAAQTLPVPNASHRILEKIGFRCVRALEHPDDGAVLEWQLAKGRGS